MDALKFDAFDDLDEEFDPLEADDSVINQDDMDDDNPYDTVDYPTMRNMPDPTRKVSLYTPERLGSADEAIMQLMDHNPARREVFMGILTMCEGGCASSRISAYVEEVQKNNRSVFSPMTLCRVLERAGALELAMPEVTDEHEEVAEGTRFLEIKGTVDPVWTSTQAGMEALAALNDGASFRDIIMDRDSRYLAVYRAVMELIAAEPRKTEEVNALVDTFEEVQSPKRFGTHFLDILERTHAIVWKDHAWTLTDLGASMLPNL